MHKPKSNEYPSYYSRYIDLIKSEDILSVLENQNQDMHDLLSRISEEAATFRYAPEKWSIKEVIGHVIDVERIFVYRALRIARGDKTPLPGFEEDDYVKNANFDSRTLIDLSDEFRSVRESTLTMFSSFEEKIYSREGTASGLKFTVRSIPFIIAGHEVHHRQVIKDKYMSA
jgi:uncharacterized damage-inducible protein DinB